MQDKHKPQQRLKIATVTPGDLLAVMSFVTHPGTLGAAAQGLQQTAGPTLEDILNTKAGVIKNKAECQLPIEGYQ